ncbi:MAG: hypothetical protein CMIDDMOC_00772 [Sodalis sp. Fle]|nr:MAG: hypothetical protein CMIDDMOC_00772 [Sodalis sp. Fle]
MSYITPRHVKTNGFIYLDIRRHIKLATNIAPITDHKFVFRFNCTKSFSLVATIAMNHFPVCPSLILTLKF